MPKRKKEAKKFPTVVCTGGALSNFFWRIKNKKIIALIVWEESRVHTRTHE